MTMRLTFAPAAAAPGIGVLETPFVALRQRIASSFTAQRSVASPRVVRTERAAARVALRKPVAAWQTGSTLLEGAVMVAALTAWVVLEVAMLSGAF